MKYEYILVTLDKVGNLISRKPVASTLSDGVTVKNQLQELMKI